MASKTRRAPRAIDLLGGLCVVATLLLTSFVEGVRAEEDAEALMTVHPPRMADAPAEPDPAPAAAPQAAPQIIHLNTRGYNYGAAPGEIDRAAMRHERQAAPPAAPDKPAPRR